MVGGGGYHDFFLVSQLRRCGHQKPICNKLNFSDVSHWGLQSEKQTPGIVQLTIVVVRTNLHVLFGSMQGLGTLK